MAKPPAFQFYANDFMDATSGWEANAVGLYVRCLCKQWTLGSIPSDLKVLARMVHCDRSELESVWPVLSVKFIDQGDGTLKNSRLEVVRERQEYVSGKRSEAGKLGAIAKANASADGPTKKMQRKVKEKEKVKVEGEVEGEGGKIHDAVLWPAFSDWWDLYDKSRDKGDCEAEWDKLDHPTREAIMRHTGEYVKNTEKKFRRDPIRYLRKKTWLNEVIETTANGNATGKGSQPTPAEAAQRTADYFARKRASGIADA